MYTQRNSNRAESHISRIIASHRHRHLERLGASPRASSTFDVVVVVGGGGVVSVIITVMLGVNWGVGYTNTPAHQRTYNNVPSQHITLSADTNQYKLAITTCERAPL